MDLSIPFLPLFEGIQEKGWKGRFPKFVSFQKKKNHFETKSIFSKKVNKKRLTWQKKNLFEGRATTQSLYLFKKKKPFWNKKWFFFFEKILFVSKWFFFFVKSAFFCQLSNTIFEEIQENLVSCPSLQKDFKKKYLWSIIFISHKWYRDYPL